MQRGLPPSDRSISIVDLLTTVRRNMVIILSVIVVCTLGSGISAWLMPLRYQATTLLDPVTSQSNSGTLNQIGSVGEQLGGLASLAGISLGSDSDKAVIVATLQSEALTERFIQQNNLLPALFSNHWDARRGGWIVKPNKRVPTVWQGYQYFSKHVLNVTQNTRTGLVTLSVIWTDPKLAASWADALVSLTNDTLRNRAIDQSERNIAYLKDQVSKTNSVQLRDAIYTLMENQIKNEMLARGSEEYALRVVDPAIPPEKASYPRRLLWILAGAFAGLIVGLMIAFARESLAQDRQR